MNTGNWNDISCPSRPASITPLNIRMLLAGDYNEITDSILSGKVDCGFLSSPVHRDFMFTPLYDDPMLVFMSKLTDPFTAKESLTLAEVKNVATPLWCRS